MASHFQEQDEPMFVISIAARLVDMHPQTLRYYERAGLVKPTRTRGRIRLYSQRDIERLRKISRLVDDLGVNLAGVEVILNLTEKLEAMQRLLEQHNVKLPEELVAIPKNWSSESKELPVGNESVPSDSKTRRQSRAAAETIRIKVRRPRAPSQR